MPTRSKQTINVTFYAVRAEYEGLCDRHLYLCSTKPQTQNPDFKKTETYPAHCQATSAAAKSSLPALKQVPHPEGLAWRGRGLAELGSRLHSVAQSVGLSMKSQSSKDVEP